MESSDFATAGANAGAIDAMGTTGSMNNASTGASDTEQSGGLADRARGALGTAGEKLSGVGSTVREKAGDAKDSLANVLDGRGMTGAATWVRDADLDSLKSSIEQQVKEHPGRTLLIAVGLGYLLGKALRK